MLRRGEGRTGLKAVSESARVLVVLTYRCAQNTTHILNIHVLGYYGCCLGTHATSPVGRFCCTGPRRILRFLFWRDMPSNRYSTVLSMLQEIWKRTSCFTQGCSTPSLAVDLWHNTGALQHSCGIPKAPIPPAVHK